MQPNQTRRKKFSYNFHKLPRVGEETGGELLWKGGTQTLCICHNPIIKEPWVGAQDRHLCCPSFNHLWVTVANCRGKHIASLCFENQEIVKYEHCIASSVYAHEECVVMLSFHHKHQLVIKFPYHEQHCGIINYIVIMTNWCRTMSNIVGCVQVLLSILIIEILSTASHNVQRVVTIM